MAFELLLIGFVLDHHFSLPLLSLILGGPLGLTNLLFLSVSALNLDCSLLLFLINNLLLFHSLLLNNLFGFLDLLLGLVVFLYF